MVPTFLDCGTDAEGLQLVLQLPNVMLVRIQAPPEGHDQRAEIVTLVFQTGKEEKLSAEHSREFLLRTGMRPPEASGIIVPDFGPPTLLK